MQRVSHWLKESEATEFLKSNYGLFKTLGHDKVVLAPGGKPRRIGVMDGSFMGGHYVCVLALVGKDMTYPWEIKGCPGRGHELNVAKSIIKAMSKQAAQRPIGSPSLRFSCVQSPSDKRGT